MGNSEKVIESRFVNRENERAYLEREYLNPTSCLFIGSGGKLGNFQTVINVISIGYISG